MDKLISVRLGDKACFAFLKKFNGSTKPRSFWMINKGIPNILYDSAPFATSRNEKISCKQTSKQRSKDLSLCKCDARIYVRSIWCFPSFEIAGVCMHMSVWSKYIKLIENSAPMIFYSNCTCTLFSSSSPPIQEMRRCLTSVKPCGDTWRSFLKTLLQGRSPLWSATTSACPLRGHTRRTRSRSFYSLVSLANACTDAAKDTQTQIYE